MAPAKVKVCIPGAVCLTAFVDRDKDPLAAAEVIADRIETETGLELTLEQLANLRQRVEDAQKAS